MKTLKLLAHPIPLIPWPMQEQKQRMKQTLITKQGMEKSAEEKGKARKEWRNGQETLCRQKAILILEMMGMAF